MATFVDMLNQGLSGLNTPLGQFGTQLMLNSGPQPGNPGGGARLGQALAGMQQMQGQQQQLEMQNQLRQVQAQEMAMRARSLDREDRKDRTMQSILQSPEVVGSMTPIQRQLMTAGYTPADIAKIQPQAKQATPPGMYDEPQPDGTYIRKVWDPQQGGYNSSVPFVPPQAQTAGVAVDRWNTEKQYVPQEQARSQQSADAASQNALATQQRVALEQAKSQREGDKATMEGKFKRLEFKQAYRGASSQLEDVEKLAMEIAASKALPSLYGPNGYIPPVAGSAAADLQAKVDQLKSKGGLAELVKLKQNGVALTPVSNTDLLQAQTSFANFDKLQSDVQARETFTNVATTMRKAREEAAVRYNEYDSLYDDKAPTAGAAQNVKPVTISDDAGYNALPSGATFTGPDGILRRKP